MSSKRSVDEVRHDSPLWNLAPYLALIWLALFWILFFSSLLPGVGAGDVDRLDILYAVPEILWQNVFPNRGLNDASSWGNLGQRIPILSCAIYIFSGALSLGRILIRQMKLADELDRIEFNALSGGLGMSILSVMTLGFGLLGYLAFTLFAVLPLVFIAIDIVLSLKSPGSNQESKTKAQQSPNWTLFSCFIFLCPMLLGALLPSTDFDVNEYHLEGPKEYFLTGQIQFLPHNVYTSFPFLTEMLSLYGMVLQRDWWTGALVGKTVLMAFAPITAMGTYSVGRRVAGSRCGILAALVYLSTPWTYRISIIAYTEGAMCCYVILSVLALLVWFDQLSVDKQPHARLSASLLVGLITGSAIATKYPGLVVVAVPVALLLLLTVLLKKIPVKQCLTMAGCFVLGGILTIGPWIGKNLAETGNPVYPLMYSVFGGEDWDDDLNAKWKAGHARPTPLLKAPDEMLTELKKNIADVTIGSVWQSPLMFGLAPLAFLYRKRNRQFWIVVGAAVTILSVWYTMTHLIDRFWVPVLPVVAVLSGIGITAVRELFQSDKKQPSMHFVWCRRGLNAICIVTLFFNFAFMTTPACGYNAYLIDYKVAREQVKPPSVQIAESVVGENDRVLFVGEAMVFDCECEYRYNTVFDYSLLEQWTSKRIGEDQWELLTSEETATKFREEGITHIVINWKEILRYRTTYGYTDFISPKRIVELGERWPFVEVPLPESYNLRDYETVDDAWKTEIEAWGPELKRVSTSGDVKMMQYQLFVPKSD